MPDGIVIGISAVTPTVVFSKILLQEQRLTAALATIFFFSAFPR